MSLNNCNFCDPEEDNQEEESQVYQICCPAGPKACSICIRRGLVHYRTQCSHCKRQLGKKITKLLSDSFNFNSKSHQKLSKSQAIRHPEIRNNHNGIMAPKKQQQDFKHNQNDQENLNDPSFFDFSRYYTLPPMLQRNQSFSPQHPYYGQNYLPNYPQYFQQNYQQWQPYCPPSPMAAMSRPSQNLNQSWSNQNAPNNYQNQGTRRKYTKQFQLQTVGLLIRNAESGPVTSQPNMSMKMGIRQNEPEDMPRNSYHGQFMGRSYRQDNKTTDYMESSQASKYPRMNRSTSASNLAVRR